MCTDLKCLSLLLLNSANVADISVLGRDFLKGPNSQNLFLLI